MSRPSEQDFGVQESPIYTEGYPLVWVDVSVLERRIDKFEQVVGGGRLRGGRLRGSALIKDTLPLSLELYAALNKVRCLVATKLANSIEVSVFQNKYHGLSGLLIFITDLLENIDFRLIAMDRVDVLSRCILESTKFMAPIDAITTIWRLECSLSKEEIPFYTELVPQSDSSSSQENKFSVMGSEGYPE